MTTPDPMDQLRFDRLAPGTYGTAPPSKSLRALESWVRPTRYDDDLFRGGGMKGGTFGTPTRGGFGYTDFLSLGLEPSKPEEIVRLEQVLTASYGKPAKVISVSDSHSARKRVREVRFHTDGDVAKVWVFQASPAETLRELKIYHLIGKHTNIQTAKPIGFEPKPHDTSYPYDVAILGGIVEHAGESYNTLLHALHLSAERTADTACVIAGMIPTYQLPLTAVQAEFAAYGVDIPQGGPRRELSSRLLAALHREPVEAEGLLRVCEQLAAAQGTPRVISHGDLHTGNIVTVTEEDFLGQRKHRTDRFGIIDWESLTIDHPYADLLNFWVHHERMAQRTLSVSTERERYAGAGTTIHDAYRNVPAALLLNMGSPDLEWATQRALWHLYELFDPLRTDATDIQRKAEYHAAALGQSLDTLADLGQRTATDALRRELLPLLASHPALHPLIVSQH